jgi:predicted metal-binding membrane protein
MIVDIIMNAVGATLRRDPARDAAAVPLSRRAFPRATVIAFAACAALAIAWGASISATWAMSTMSSMGDVPMPGGWNMSMMWAPMCGQKWLRVAASFVGMWIVMMVAMMLPSLAPALWRYHEVLGRTGARRTVWLTALAGIGYFFVWTVLGVAVFALGNTLMEAALRLPALARAVPVAAGVAVMAGGALQCSAWKARYLACCRAASVAPKISRRTDGAWHHGIRLGVHCVACCAGLTSALIASGMMDLRAMTLVTAALTAERFVPSGARIARAIGIVVIATGCSMLVLAVAGR